MLTNLFHALDFMEAGKGGGGGSSAPAPRQRHRRSGGQPDYAAESAFIMGSAPPRHKSQKQQNLGSLFFKPGASWQ